MHDAGQVHARESKGQGINKESPHIIRADPYYTG